MKILLEGNKMIEVCMKVGYSNIKTFHLTFKKRTKMIPMEFVVTKNDFKL